MFESVNSVSHERFCLLCVLMLSRTVDLASLPTCGASCCQHHSEWCQQGLCYYHPITLATSQHMAQAKAQLDKGLAELKRYRATAAD